MTYFKSAISACGLSQQDAAEYLSVSINTVKSWCQGRRHTPIGVWAQLSGLYLEIEQTAIAETEKIKHLRPGEIDFIGEETSGHEKMAKAVALLCYLRIE